MSLTTGVNHPINRPIAKQKLRFQGEGSPATASGVSGGSMFGVIAKGVASFKTPDTMQKIFLNTSREGAMAIVPLESAVLVGRSERAYRRDGWLELQERLTEEIAAAVVWLFGVDYLQKQFEKVASKTNQGNNQHLSTNIAWNKPWVKSTHVDLTPQEMFAKHYKDVNVLLTLKSARWLFSVGLALAAVGYLIPKGNQLKTNLILKHLERRKRSAEGSNVQFGDPARQNRPNGPQLGSGQHPLPPIPPHVFSAANTAQSVSAQTNPQNSHSQNHTGSTAQSQAVQGTPNILSKLQAVSPFQTTHFPILGQHNSNSPNAAQGKPDVRFSGGFPGLSMVQALGAGVEQTQYGSLLAVDFGIAGGRGYVASKRSPYETAEVLFRDIVSLYFYILCAPHLMKAVTSVLDRVFGASSQLQPKVAALIKEEIHKGLELQQKLGQGIQLDKILFGAGDALMAPEGELRKALRLAPTSSMQELLKLEKAVYLGGRPLPPKAKAALDVHLTKDLANLDPAKIEHLLNAIEDGQGGFAELATAERKNLGIAVKQAFRHTVGMPVEFNKDLAEHKVFKGVFDKLKEIDSAKGDHVHENALKGRIEHMAKLDSLDQTHSMLRRSANVARTTMTNTPLLKRGDALADWVDKALHHGQTLEEFLPEEIKGLAHKLHGMKLSEISQQKVKEALGGQELSSLANVEEVMKTATTKQLIDLKEIFTDLHHEIATGETLKKVWPFNSQARQVRAMKEQLSDMNYLLEGGKDNNPVTAMKKSITSFAADIEAKTTGAEQKLLGHYSKKIEKLQTEGRLFSLGTQHEDAALGLKLREMLRGGLINDSRILNQSLDIMGQLETSSRKMPATANADKMRHAITNYTETLYKRFHPANTHELSAKVIGENLETFFKLNRNLHFVARGTSLAITMACIGWLVPILQTKITKQLTGKDKNPGIASAKKLVDDNNAPKAPATKPTTAFGNQNWGTQSATRQVSYPNQPKPQSQVSYYG